MSFTYKKRGRREVLYFQAGRAGTLYIMPKDCPEDVKAANVEKAIKYMQTRLTKDREIVAKLIALLPPEKKRQYSSLLE